MLHGAQNKKGGSAHASRADVLGICARCSPYPDDYHGITGNVHMLMRHDDDDEARCGKWMAGMT